jgi:hypothetical protein
MLSELKNLRDLFIRPQTPFYRCDVLAPTTACSLRHPITSSPCTDIDYPSPHLQLTSLTSQARQAHLAEQENIVASDGCSWNLEVLNTLLGQGWVAKTPAV